MLASLVSFPQACGNDTKNITENTCDADKLNSLLKGESEKLEKRELISFRFWGLHKHRLRDYIENFSKEMKEQQRIKPSQPITPGVKK